MNVLWWWYFYIENMNINITGNFFAPTDPLDVYLENIGYDVAKSQDFYDFSLLNWNYPEAKLETEIYINNIYTENSNIYSRRTLGYIIFSREVANVTISNVNWEKWYTTSTDISSCLTYALVPTWLPTDSVIQKYTADNVTFDISIDNTGDRIALSSFNQYYPHYRKIQVVYKNFLFKNINPLTTDFAFFGGDLTAMDTYDIINYTITNWSTPLYFALYMGGGQQTFKNITFENISKISSSALFFRNSFNITIEDFELRNFNSFSPTSQLDFSNFEYAEISGITIVDSWFRNAGFLSVSKSFDKMTVKNGYYENVNLMADSSFLEFAIASSFSISNHSIVNSQSIEKEDSTLVFIEILSMEVMDNSSVALEDLSFENSSVSLIGIKNMLGSPSSNINFPISKVKFSNSYFTTSRTLIPLSGFASEADLTIQLNAVEFSNIEYKFWGDLMLIDSQLPNTIVVSNTKIHNVTSGMVRMDTYRISIRSVQAKARFENLEIINVSSSNRPTMTIDNYAQLEVINGLFTDITNLNNGAGVLSISTSAKVEMTNATFKENSALVAAVVLARSDGLFKWTNWTLKNNFALSTGIGTAREGGRFEFYDSKISNSYALLNPIWLIKVTHYPTIFNNVEIYENEYISTENLKEELENCHKLWFLNEKMIASLLPLDFSTLKQSRPAVQVILGSLKIINGSNIHNQPIFLDSFTSEVEIDGITLSDITLEYTSIEIVSSEFNMSNVEIKNIQKIEEGIQKYFHLYSLSI